ncbi:MAG: hypothetical protein J0H86_06240 [Xanthomonadaceae bacterium]|nr:hypothetical protein [Xanthomonadaceae bacterium]
MNRIRRHRWCTHLSLLVAIVLVWAQLVLASHPACAWRAMASASGYSSPALAATAPSHAHHGAGSPAEQAPPPCHETQQGDDETVCAYHCSHGDLSKDAARVLSVPTLGPLPLMLAVVVRQLPAARFASEAYPRGAWHRPTPHPASLLLI